MIPISTEEQHYSQLAIDLLGQSILLKCDASVHVEDFDDAVFWEGILNHYTSNRKKFNIIWYSQTPKGNEATGVVHCLKFKPYLNQKFFICIDSDYRYLLQEPEIDVNHFILQTYTYAIENHYCFSDRLNEIPLKCTGLINNIFDFKTFLIDYTRAVYDAFIWHLLLLKQNDDSSFSKDEFSKMISLLQCAPLYDITHNGKEVIHILEERCRKKTDELKHLYPHIDLDAEKVYFQTLGLHANNAYLYVRGHDLYDLIYAIGKEVNEALLNTEKERLANNEAIKRLFSKKKSFNSVLDKDIQFGEYAEIDKIGEDVIAICS